MLRDLATQALNIPTSLEVGVVEKPASQVKGKLKPQLTQD